VGFAPLSAHYLLAHTDENSSAARWPHHRPRFFIRHTERAQQPMKLLSTSLPLRTPRVALRLLRESDLAAFQAYRGDAELGRYQGWTVMSQAQALEFLVEMAAVTTLVPGDWVQLGIAESQRDDLIGDIGLFLGADGQEAEIGFTLARAWQRQGLAAEAVQAAIRLVFDCSGAQRLRAITDARNLPSIGLLRRVGFTHVETHDTMFRGEPCTEWVFRLVR
jgi:[ribosomal protein S5]-alanine N-acetyltransferase